MLKINLLERKVTATGPFSQLLEKLGLANLSPEDTSLFIQSAIKAVVLAVGIYLSDYVPEYFRLQKIHELDTQISDQEAKQATLSRELKAKEAVRQEMSRMQTQEAELKRKIEIISALDNDRHRAFKVLDTVSLLIPDRVWIDSLTFSPAKVDFSGASYEFIPINDFVTSLKQSGAFDSVRLNKINASPAPKIVANVPLAIQTIKRYDVTMDLKAPVAAEKPGAGGPPPAAVGAPAIPSQAVPPQAALPAPMPPAAGEKPAKPAAATEQPL